MEASPEPLTFKAVFMVRGYGKQVERGICKIAPAGIGFKSTATSVVLRKEELAAITLAEVGASKSTGKPILELAITEVSGLRTDIRGLPAASREQVEAFVRAHFGIEPAAAKYEARGWNWGDVELTAAEVRFSTDGRTHTSFDVPFSEIINASSQRAELLLEFAASLDKAQLRGTELSEIRFHMPGESDAGTRAEEMCADIHSNISVMGGDVVCSFADVKATVPRGRYDIAFQPDSVSLRGRTHSYKIAYTSVARIFALPVPQGRRSATAIVLGLSKPLRQGQTLYHHVVFELPDEDDQVEVELTLPAAEVEARFGAEGVVEGALVGTKYESLCRVFKTFTGRRITQPGAYESNEGAFLSAVHHAHTGFLFPLDRAFFFMYRPCVFIRYASVVRVQVTNLTTGRDGARGHFSLVITTKNTPKFQFDDLNERDVDSLKAFLEAKGLAVDTKYSWAEGARPQDDDLPDTYSDDETFRDEGSVPEDDEEPRPAPTVTSE
eukprot:gnl/Chilomastix_cuspidata/2673.p2 GENE.gnl/Chilomastix_cuspidata/2673~~gnl/Chilomastix_cuspidata/2673.p2  ORF type:complete len:496 (+),score=263.68 gnl/Chilomastix_cuspidata/2673:1225-2712(+)